MKTKEFRPQYCPSSLMPPVAAYLDDCMYVGYLQGSLSGVGFKCPCGCGLPLFIPNEPFAEGGSVEPRKIIRNPDDTITITPSILVNFGCRSHFHITNNKVTP